MKKYKIAVIINWVLAALNIADLSLIAVAVIAANEHLTGTVIMDMAIQALFATWFIFNGINSMRLWKGKPCLKWVQITAWIANIAIGILLVASNWADRATLAGMLLTGFGIAIILANLARVCDDYYCHKNH